jgi:hypothetical protein
MKLFAVALVSATLLASGSAYADRYQSLGQVNLQTSAVTPEGQGHVDMVQAKPEGNGHVDIAQARPEGNGHVDIAQARPEGNGHVDIAQARPADTYPQTEGHVQMGG